jgi:hypothetical protein
MGGRGGTSALGVGRSAGITAEGHKSLLKEEMKIVDKDVEYAVLVHPTTGKVIVRNRSDQFAATSGLTGKEEKNLVFTHNHPPHPNKYSWGFSPADLAYAAHNDLAAIRAVSREKDGVFVYEFKRPADGWGKTLDAYGTRSHSVGGFLHMEKQMDAAMEKPAFIRKASKLAEKNPSKNWNYAYSHAAYHLRAEEVAKETGATYTRTKIN